MDWQPPFTWYPVALRCKPSHKNLPRFRSSLSAASYITLHTSTTGIFSCTPIAFTASAYDFVTWKRRSNLSGGSREERIAALWYVSTGGGVNRMIDVDGEYREEVGDLIICTRLRRFFEYSARGTCCGEGSIQESLPPSQIVKRRTF